MGGSGRDQVPGRCVGDVEDTVQRMYFHPLIAVAFLLPATGAVGGTGVRTASPSTNHPDGNALEGLRYLCHGSDLCWEVVLTPPVAGPSVVRVKFPDARRVVLPGDPYCERREYWHVSGVVRTLLTVDCAEQWGPDSQAPVLLALGRDKLTVSYVEFLYDNECEKAVARLELSNAKVISFKRWSGQATADGRDCGHLRSQKDGLLGKGTLDSPLLQFHSDVLPMPSRSQ